MNDKKFMLIVIMFLAGLCFGFIRTSASGDWVRNCDGRLVIEKTAGVWSVTCKQGGSGIEVITESSSDPTPWPRDATTEYIFRATETPLPYPIVPDEYPYPPAEVYP